VTNSSSFIIDNPDAAIFKVNRRVFTDAEIMEQEREKIFEKCWLYVGHESEIPNRGDFVTRKLAGRPVIMVRGYDGNVRVLLNTCTHRGAMVCREHRGNAKTFQCFYHAWTFDNQGCLVGVPGEDAYGPGFQRSELGLKAPANAGIYRGFVFTTFNRNAPSLTDYLGGAIDYLDRAYEQGQPDGLEIVGGTHDYCMYGNWKLVVENSFDPYHLGPTHQRYFQFMQHLGISTIGRNDPGKAKDLGNGHAVVEISSDVPIGRLRDDRLEPRLDGEQSEGKVGYNHLMVIFPNLILINVFRMVRTVFPVAPNYVEVSAWALMPKGDSREIRRARLDNYLTFLGPGGFGTPDDAEAVESCQRGFANNKEIEWTNVSRGITRDQPIGTDELQLRAFWRRWNEMMVA
jgi:p-cumate 2,3-dioxygenase subunit alpha